MATYTAGSSTPPTMPPKDPDAILDYQFDWSDYLEDGEIITASSWTVEAGLTKVSDSFTNTTTSIWLSGGTDTTTYTVSCKITTSAGNGSGTYRKDERGMKIQVVNR